MKHPLRTGRLSWLALTALSTGFFLATDSYFFFLLCALLLFLPLFSLLALRLGKKTLCVRLEHAEGHVRLCLDDPAARSAASIIRTRSAHGRRMARQA